MFRLSRRGSLKIGSVIGALIAALAMAQSVRATSATLDLTSPINSPSCTPGATTSASIVATIDSGTHYFEFYIANPARGTDSASGVILGLGGPGVYNLGINVLVPPSTVNGDTLVFTVTVHNDAAQTQLLAQQQIAYNCATGEIIVSGVSANCDDGRLNGNCSAPVAVYCDGDSIDVYSVDPDGHGTLAFRFDPGGYTPGEGDPVVVGSGSGVTVFYLPQSGQFQVHAYQADGKLYTFIWSSCGAGGDAEFSEYED